MTESKNAIVTFAYPLFLFCLSLKMIFLFFSSIFSLKCINTTYIFPVYTLKYTKGTSFLSLSPLKPSHIPFMLAFGIQNINQSFFLTSKPLDILLGTLFVVCLPLNTLFLLFFSVQVVIASAAQILLHFHRKKTSFSCFCFSFVIHC